MVVFVDTNVLIYRRDAAHPEKQAVAERWIDHLWRHRTGRTSAQVLSEYYASVTRKLSKPLSAQRAWSDVEELLGWRPRAVDTEVLRLARALQARFQLSWWDAMVVAAAQLEACDLLLTEDLQDGMRLGDLTVRDPFRLGVEEALAAYGRPASGAPRAAADPPGRTRSATGTARGAAAGRRRTASP